MAERPIVIVTRKLPDVVETRLRELFDARLNLDDKPFSREELIEAVKPANVLVPTVTDRIDRGVLSQAGSDLKLIAQFGTGVDNIDLETARNRSIIVTNTPGVLTEDTADMTMALILAVPRRLVEGAAVLISDEDWAGWTPTWMLGHRIWGKRLGIIGMGRIGSAVARRATAFGMDVVHASRERGTPLGELLETSDIVSLHTPLTEATRHIINREALGRMKRGAYLVNTSRGPLVDEQALCEALDSGHLFGSAFDVFPEEPIPAGSRLLTTPNIVMTPHLAGASKQTAAKAAAIIAGDVGRYLRGEPLAHCANPDALRPANR